MIRTNSENPDFKKLTDQLDDELCAIYNTNKADYEEYNLITNLPTVILAYDNDTVIGCGCFKIYDENTIELKRMFVTPAFRGKGIASSMVRKLEHWAIELGFRNAVLETGTGQPEAIAMYHKLGYFNYEKPGLNQEIGHSVFMRKQLV
ncbi:GNAT family N-acetyltransferase [Dyadobacter chenwenxiniae]|uniref:GNAT family N-acetyltransferase n=1 Tax=Dyadobacter chenwenxiniae TaxID=2906456 RepID=A0A9X1TH09_9BACT|nr:GNAT family N-acetyltransferase [Dyadobacter chenwenxiniae]MCF0064240.1 GNAT family N-acetyltransferase [Dyadobacter chenwenxiniae]UON82546.1 GNAT family N-acetyltransferase [Dyadobacter chenwenxiniae]